VRSSLAAALTFALLVGCPTAIVSAQDAPTPSEPSAPATTPASAPTQAQAPSDEGEADPGAAQGQGAAEGEVAAEGEGAAGTKVELQELVVEADATASSEAAEATAEAQATESDDTQQDEAGDDEESETDDEEDEEEDEGGGYHHRGIPLPGDLRLNGIFDVAYERRDYSGDLGDGRDGINNYHHFLFLRRDARGDPFSIDIELVDLSFYEIGVRFTEHSDPWQVSLKLGKILVPFGDEPLFHHPYGGALGFDQRFLPIIWARHGVAAQVRHRFGDLSVRNDAYVVHGHELDTDDAVIDLQTDLSSSTDARWALGDRVGLAWEAISVWYSIYYNRVRFDRQLLLQAIDISLWRPHGIPVLEDLAITLGVARADVSGGTWTEERVPLEHYYHFADYLRLQYFITEWLQLDARTGIVTTNNREGVYRDEDRDDVTDVTTHAIGLTARFMGFSASLHHHWRYERRDEIPNDLLRLRLSYAF
jgi:hypothetical protein